MRTQLGHQQHCPCSLTVCPLLLGRKHWPADAQTDAPWEPPVCLVLLCGLSLARVQSLRGSSPAARCEKPFYWALPRGLHLQHSQCWCLAAPWEAGGDPWRGQRSLLPRSGAAEDMASEPRNIPPCLQNLLLGAPWRCALYQWCQPPTWPFPCPPLHYTLLSLKRNSPHFN